MSAALDKIKEGLEEAAALVRSQTSDILIERARCARIVRGFIPRPTTHERNLLDWMASVIEGDGKPQDQKVPTMSETRSHYRVVPHDKEDWKVQCKSVLDPEWMTITGTFKTFHEAKQAASEHAYDARVPVDLGLLP